ncbi:MAG: cell wall-binding repeat-containing protein [Coriobacteriales bacterium]|nr:cell wall-binding repeat-containing protein [Coriobacteriales bacterium]
MAKVNGRAFRVFFVLVLIAGLVMPSAAAFASLDQAAEDPVGVAPLSDDAGQLETQDAAAEIVLAAQEGGALTISNRWQSDIIVSQSGKKGTTTIPAAYVRDLTISVSQGERITIRESVADATFRSWYVRDGYGFGLSSDLALVSGVPCAITAMPHMSAFTEDKAGTIAGVGFFSSFNAGGSLVSLPQGSFDTSAITTVGDCFFAHFNGYGYGSYSVAGRGGSLSSLPEHSFDISKISSAKDFFFASFNKVGALSSLPAGSFNTSNISGAVGEHFFYTFNYFGSLSSLPAGSFNISRINTVGDGFFYCFNDSGALTSLPAGSFDTSKITSVGGSFFMAFNLAGDLTTLPAGSFNISGITDAGGAFFYYFNGAGGFFPRLPETPRPTANSSSVSAAPFAGADSASASLPEDSPDVFPVTPTADPFMGRGGALTSLPAGSFDTSHITTAGYGFLFCFNQYGALSSLPAGSFNTSKITVAGPNFMSGFNLKGSLASLPSSFSLPQKLSSVGTEYCSYLFADSALTRGDEQVPLHFASAASDAFTGTDIAPASPTAGVTVSVNSSKPWPRLDGNKGQDGDRFDTMQAIVGEGWDSTGSDTVIVAHSHDFPDALAASGLAGIYDAPVVLTAKDRLTDQARATIESLGASKAYIIGGDAAVSEAVKDSLAELLGGAANVERVSGENRFATALDIYREGSESTEGWGDTAIIANGFNFADALSVSPYANVMHYPIFLSTPDTRPESGLDADTIAAINSGGFKKLIITGGTAAVPGIVEEQLASAGVTIERWMGANRYETSVDIIEKSLQASGGALSLNNIVCATGFNYPDALAGGAFAGHIGTVLLLIDDAALREGGYTGLERIIRPHASEIGQGYVLGGEGAVPAELLELLKLGSREGSS